MAKLMSFHFWSISEDSRIIIFYFLGEEGYAVLFKPRDARDLLSKTYLKGCCDMIVIQSNYGVLITLGNNYNGIMISISHLF